MNSKGYLSVLFITRKWPPAMGGMETYSKRVAERLSEKCDLSVLALPGRENGAAPTSVSLIAFGLKTFFQVLFGKTAPDIVHIGDMASWPLALAAKLRSRKTKVVLSAHGTDVSLAFRKSGAGRIYKLYQRLAVLIFGKSQVIANSNATSVLAKKLGFTKVAVVPLGTDMQPQDPVGPSTTILFAGRLTTAKGGRWFAENVLPELPDKLRLAIAGRVWDASENVVFDHPRVDKLGVLAPHEMPQAYAGALCVVVPNIDETIAGFEGYGLVASEAAAAGGVVLASRLHGLTDAVVDGETGFLMPHGQTEQWVEKIIDISQWDNETRAAFVSKATQTAQSVFSWDRVADVTLAIYQKALPPT